jgi:hypothetical protein
VAVIGLGLLAAPAAEAFLCFRSGPSTKSFGRPLPPIPPIMPYAISTPPANVSWHAPIPVKDRPPRPHNMRWRPLDHPPGR